MQSTGASVYHSTASMQFTSGDLLRFIGFTTEIAVRQFTAQQKSVKSIIVAKLMNA